SNNSWTLPVTVSSADFTSLDATQLTSPRNADGSLPDITFMHLKTGSDLINAGTNVGLPFVGSAPDLGAFEVPEPCTAVVGGLALLGCTLRRPRRNRTCDEGKSRARRVLP